MVLFLGYIEERWGYLVNQEKKKNGKKSVKFKIKVIMRSSKNQLSCYMTLFGNFAPYDLHALRRMVCGGFVVNSVTMTFKIPEKKKKKKRWLK